MPSTQTRSLTVLGHFTLCVDHREVTGLPRKAQALIAYLSLQPDRHVPREIVADLLWTRSGPQQGRQSLRQMLVVLRRSPAGDIVGADANVLWIDPAAVAVDALALEAGLTATDQPALSDCAALYRGELLADLPAVSPAFDEWLRPERAKFAGIMGQTLRRLATAQVAAQQFDAAVQTAARLVAMDALDEAAHRLCIDCLARAGRRTEALQQFEACARVLQAELDIAPEAETVALAERIRAGPWSVDMTVGLPLPEDTPAARPAPPAHREAAHAPAASRIAAAGKAEQNGPAAPPAQPPAVLPAQPPAVLPAQPWYRVRKRCAWAAAALCIVAIAVAALPRRQPPMRLSMHPPEITVAAFRNVSGIPAGDIVLAGFGDLLKARLAMRHHLRLSVDPNGATERDGTRPAAATRYMLEGSVALNSDAMRVTVRLTDMRQDAELWSSQYDRPVVEAAGVADDIAAHTALAVSQDHDVILRSPPLLDPHGHRVARELVSLGHHIDYFAAANNVASQDIYRLASQIDKTDVDVMAHLANADIRSAFASGPMDQTGFADADAILLRATQLDPTNLYALFNFCLLRRLQGRIGEAIVLCKRVLDIDPRYPGALRELGSATLQSGDAAQAITWYKASIDAAPALPYNFLALKGLGVASLALGRRDDAVTYFRKAINADLWHVDDAQLWLAAALEMNDHHAEATHLLEEFMSKHVGLKVDGDYLGLLNAPAYADCRNDVLAAVAGAGYAKE